MVKRRGRRTRANPPRVHSVLDRLRSGVPTTQGSFPRDPKSIPHILTVPIRVRLNLFGRSDATSAAQVLQLPAEPTSPFNIVMKFNPARTINTIFGWTITTRDVFRAACMRVYGVDPTLTPIGQNFYNSDFGIQKVILYGPDSRTNVPTSGISLSVDYGPTIPGFAGRDMGGANTRAVVGSSAPRVSWMNFGMTSTTLASGYCNVSNIPYQTGVPDTVLELALGCVDFSIIVRRGAVFPAPIPTPPTSDAEYIDSEGNVKSLSEYLAALKTAAAS